MDVRAFQDRADRSIAAGALNSKPMASYELLQEPPPKKIEKNTKKTRMILPDEGSIGIIFLYFHNFWGGMYRDHYRFVCLLGMIIGLFVCRGDSLTLAGPTDSSSRPIQLEARRPAAPESGFRV